MDFTEKNSLQSGLCRTLKTRHLTMIAFGGAIGTGLFLASGSVIHTAGPGGAMLAYFLMGVIVYILMCGLGEMSAYMPVSGSFYTYASEFVYPGLGYALGWNYWYNWAITIAAEIAAADMVMQFWFPHSSSLMWSLIFISFFTVFNAVSVKGFGEVEYWLSFLKVTVIFIFIILGAAFVIQDHHHAQSVFKNWHIQGAPFHEGFLGFLSAFMVVGFSFQGTELIGVTAGESKDPQKSIPKATRNIFWRILLFYVLCIFIISLIIPYTSSGLSSSNVLVSPFTLVFLHTGIKIAASIVNAVVLIAILSAGNSGTYAATRMLQHLAQQGHVHAIFSKINKNGVPIYALFATMLIACGAFLSSFVGNGQAYIWLIDASSLSGFIAWAGIGLSHYRFRKILIKNNISLKKLPYQSKIHHYASYVAFIFCLLIIAGQNYAAFTQAHISWIGLAPSYAGLPVFLILFITFKMRKKSILKFQNNKKLYFDDELISST